MNRKSKVAAKSPGRSITRMKAKSSNPIAGITHPEKVFWPEEGYTKLDLAKFYEMVFSKLEPYVKDHLLTMERCPDGMLGQCFYQKQMPSGMPAGTKGKEIEHSKGITNYVVGGTLATQLALVNLGCIAVHAMAGRAASPRKPDWICFDLDPQSGKFADAARAGLHVKEALDKVELESFAKTSGSRGLHIFVPLKAGIDVSDVLSFAEEFVKRVAAAVPSELTVEHSIAARGNRVYLDPFRNGFGQTVVTPYSVRRREKAPVSTPLTWAEVKPTLDPATFNIGNFEKRLAKRDPWAEFFKHRQPLKKAIDRLSRL